MNQSFQNLNQIFNMDGTEVEMEDETSKPSIVETPKSDDDTQKYKIEHHDYLLTEYQAQVASLRQVADELRQACKVGAPPRLYETYANLEDKISGILDKIKELEETKTDYQVTESKEEIAKQNLELKQQKILAKITGNKNPNMPQQINLTNISNNTYTMTSNQLDDMIDEMDDGPNPNIITDETLLPKFNLD